MTDPAQPGHKPENSARTYKRLLTYLKDYRGPFAISVLGSLFFAASDPLFVKLLQTLIDMIGENTSFTTSERLLLPGMLLGIALCRGFGGFLSSYFMALVSNSVIRDLRTQLFGQFLRLPVAYYDRNSAGHLLSTVSYNTQQVNHAVTNSLVVIFQQSATVLALMMMLLFLSWKLTLVFFSVAPLIAGLVLFASRKFRKHSSRIQGSMGDVTQTISETLKGLRVIRTFGADSHVAEKFEAASELNRKQNLKLELTQAISAPVIQFMVAISISLLIYLAMSPSMFGEITAGEFVGAITAASLMLKPIRDLAKVNSPIQRGLAAAESIFSLLDEEVENDRGTMTLAEVKGHVEFRHVSFRYPMTHKLVLQDISLDCPAGQSIAIVGKSGSGKSTLVNLLPRFYDASEGEILIDGVLHKDLTLASLRQHIALVSQQVVLFNGTVKENIAYGELSGLSDEAVLEALGHANAMEFIEHLPEGINTLVGDDGIMLSGGQRQRLAIARALLKDAPILILDEATSALDTESERYIQGALERLMQGRTTFIIAHRLSTIEQADRILVMEEGAIVEQGSHAELLALGKVYSQLHRAQFREDSTES